ncbi:hypothetical protein BTJ68_03042 [Hortaea werneckii EXF-2000]|uniref:26S proteasome regulatory subunit 6B homolog n=4 Tax=Hortaea werneckii TaxID=91943 RepID=A0A1Z5TN17_HORWE|nr:hypothetical protein BTJ68_03042 [Hortaea werneckii EXF-2000]
MTDVLNNIYDYRTEDDFDPSKLFHRKVNKRVIPEYYDMIQEPIALSTIKQKIQKREYQSFTEFVRDFALIPHNAQVFNRPDSGAFQDALVIKEQLEKQLQLLVEKGTISKEVAALPYLGEIPTYEDVEMGDAGPAGAEEEESSDDDDDDDDEGEEDDDGKRKKRRGGRSGAGGARREGGDLADDGSRRARGRPPKLNTPMEARIQAILKGIRKPKDSHGQLMIRDFDRLPDKAAMPEYFAEIRNPMAYDILKRKVKRKKYQSVEDFMADVNLMFNNAKEYNTDESSIHKNATALQIEAGKLYDIEKAKPDDTFADEDGKVPMPNGILQNGELYRVGDWVHIQNPNDLTKPIPAQIYRTYKNPNGQSMVNVCWYYRPEQTVHRFDKHFFPNEVVKTGRYRDHHVEEIEGKCFIMFFTRYFKGRPRGLPEGIEIYVCEARYNEALHQFNKIKTWASCLPDEVRDKDYEMDLFEQPRRMKKFPSPIGYLLKDEQKETDDLPKVTWAATTIMASADVMNPSTTPAPHTRQIPNAALANVDTVEGLTDTDDQYATYKKLQRQLEYIKLQEEYIKDEQRSLKRELVRAQEEIKRIQSVPLVIGQFMEAIDNNTGIVQSSTGSNYVVRVLSTLDRELLKPNSTVALHRHSNSLVDILPPEADSSIAMLGADEKPDVSYADVGGMDMQKQEIREAVELPLQQFDLYKQIGIDPPRGVLLYGPPGTGKTMLVKAVANSTTASFIRVVGSEFVQKYLGEGPRMVRDVFRMARENSPAIIFIDEIDAIATKRFDAQTGADREVQRILLELLNQMDGFDQTANVKVIMATNRADTLDPALLRPGRLDRKIEFPSLRDRRERRLIFMTIASKMSLAPEVDMDSLIVRNDPLSGAVIAAIMQEAGLRAVRKNRYNIIQQDLEDAYTAQVKGPSEADKFDFYK